MRSQDHDPAAGDAREDGAPRERAVVIAVANVMAESMDARGVLLGDLTGVLFLRMALGRALKATGMVLRKRPDIQNDVAALCDAPEPTPKDVWFIWQKNGHPPRFAWPTEKGAHHEAQRLARRHPGTSFLVMHATHKFRVELPEEVAPTRPAETPEAAPGST